MMKYKFLIPALVERHYSYNDNMKRKKFMLSAPFKLIALSAMLFIVNTMPTFANNITSE